MQTVYGVPSHIWAIYPSLELSLIAAGFVNEL